MLYASPLVCWGVKPRKNPNLQKLIWKTSTTSRVTRWALNLSDQLKQQGMEVDIDVFVQGFRDGYVGESALLTSDEALDVLIQMKQEQQARHQAEENKMAEENKKAGEAFLAENKKKRA